MGILVITWMNEEIKQSFLLESAFKTPYQPAVTLSGDNFYNADSGFNPLF